MTDFSSTVATLYDQLVSHAETLGVFDAGVNPAEAWGTPPAGVWCMFSPPDVAPAPTASGLSAASGRLTFKAYCGGSLLMKPVGRADQVVLSAAMSLMAAYVGAFTLGGQVRNVDVFGAHGPPLTGSPGVMQVGEQHFRVYELTVSLIVNDLFAEVA